MKLICAVAMLVCWMMPDASGAQALPTQSRWALPAAEMAGQIADILGPGQAQVSVRNLSSIPASEVPGIRKLLEQDLRARGVLSGGGESANTIRVTLSEDARERLWVAEIVEGSETRVAMVHVDAAVAARTSAGAERVALRREAILTSGEPVLAALETAGGGLIVLEPTRIVIYSRSADGFRELQKVNLDQVRQLARDPRGVLLASSGGLRFEAWVPGVQCSGSNAPASSGTAWNIQCRASDDPWAITQPPVELTNFGGPLGQGQAGQADVSVTPVQAFYNSARNYFTGVLASSTGLDLRPFYTLAILPRPANQPALLVESIDGKVQIAENGTLRPVAGTRDWGSDFAVVRSSCGTGAQVIASGSGESAADSVRAFEIPALDAMPVSSPLTVEGALTAMWSAPDGKSAFAVVRTATNQYEVDRVSALCN